MSRYVRDEILTQGLDLAHSPTVMQHDMPGGIISPEAWSIKWLQNALDFFHRKYPFSSDILDVDIVIRAGNTDVVLLSDLTSYLPSNFILDVRDGIDVTRNEEEGFYPIFRKSYQYWRMYQRGTQKADTDRPQIYTILNNRIKVLPLLNININAILHYYALPEALSAEDAVPFPDEWVLIEYIRLKALEWTRSIEPGTAQLYLTKQLAGLRASGLLHEPEYENGIPIENSQTIIEGQVGNRNAWMGNYAI